MTDERFWEIVDSVDWPREDYKKAKVDILMNTAPNEVKELRDELDKRTKKLREKFNEDYGNAQFYVSSDGLDDCVNQIVGEGKEIYEFALRHDNVVIQKYRSGNYVESFSYAIPHPTDYDKLGTDYYQFRSTKYVGEYIDIAENEKLSEEYRRKAMHMKRVLEDFPYLRGCDSYLQRHDMIDEDGEDAVLDWMHETEEELSDDVHGWPVRNLVSDYRTFYFYNQ